ncbi:ATP synthase subunit I [Salinibius halmophilus]|uniref:ATP synthase subunit I n=1 Tax=Salinibius halmophilus TaxID=1853216 RepID=UPI000E6669DF
MLSNRPSTVKAPSLQKAFIANSLLAVGATLLALMASTDWAISVLLGWVCWLLPTYWFKLKAWRRRGRFQPSKIVQSFYQASIEKLVLTAICCALVFIQFPSVQPEVFIVSLFVLSLSGVVCIHWQLQTPVTRQKEDG